MWNECPYDNYSCFEWHEREQERRSRLWAELEEEDAEELERDEED